MANTRAQTDFWSLCHTVSETSHGYHGIMTILEEVCMLLLKVLKLIVKIWRLLLALGRFTFSQ